MSFSGICRETVSDFLNTAVLIDDQICWGPNDLVENQNMELDAPDQDEEFDAQDVTLVASAAPLSDPIDAKAIVQSFSNEGIVCSPHEWERGSDFPNSTEKADLLILDWKLPDDGDDKGKSTKEFIRTRLTRDIEKTRLRFITIYSSEKEADVINSLAENLKEVEGVEIECSGSRIDILNDQNHLIYRIHWISKKSTDEQHLAAEIIESFAQFVEGFVPNILLSAITEIRDKTYEYLAQYHSNLDVSMLTHFVSLRLSEDGFDTAENQFREYVANLIGSTIQSSLTYSQGIKTAGSLGTILMHLETIDELELANNRNTKVCNKKDEIIDVIKSDSFDNSLKELNKVSGNTFKVKNHPFFSFKEQDDVGNLELSALDLMKRRSPELNAIPVLRMGTIVKQNKDNEYYLCIQPLCDGVRLDPADGEHKFPFLKLKINEDIKNTNLVVFDNEKYNKFICETKPNNIHSFSFVSDANSKDIRAIQKDKKYLFDCPSNSSAFEWLCELKDIYAQEFLNNLASEGSRVGSDKYEWFREINPRS